MDVFENQYHVLVRIPPQTTDFRRKLDAVKKLTGRKWLDDQKLWAIPKQNYPTMDVVLKAMHNLLSKPTKPEPQDLTIEPMPELDIEIPLKKQMYHFQKQSVAYNRIKGSALNGDQQGLGKTIETIATILAMDLFPCLVITKKTLIRNWKQEWEDWTDKQVMELTLSKKHTWHNFFLMNIADVAIVNYESLAPFFVHKIEVPKGEQFRVKHIHFKEQIQLFKSVIIDESHYVKDGKTKRTKFCIGLTRHLTEKGVFLLSGTPALNDPMELYTQLTILNRQHLFGSYSLFKANYAGKGNKGNLKYLNAQLHKHCYFRRLKSEVRTDMPAKTRQVILCDIDNREEYDKAERDFVRYLREQLLLSEGEIDKKLRGAVMVQMGILKKIAARGKLNAIKEWVQDLMEQEEKIVLFAYHREIQHELVRSFPGAVAIASQQDTPMDVIQQNKKLFQESKSTNLIVCSISAASEGHTLNAASNLGMCELPWHFGKAEQCEDRIHRITNWLPANISYFLGDATIDRDIYKLIMEKKEMHDSITGTEEESETRIIDKLINIFNQK
jgi:SWI/SNF-related matrix-associated actin-dependent regulator 1 of chromatin subfamily A